MEMLLYEKILINFLFGFLVTIVVTICEFIVTLPFGEPSELIQATYSQFINRELLLTALPALLVTLMLGEAFDIVCDRDRINYTKTDRYDYEEYEFR